MFRYFVFKYFSKMGKENSENFVVFSSEAIVGFAEANGQNPKDFQSQVFSYLAEDLTYQLKELIHGAKYNMRMCKRKRLKTVDVERCLEQSNMNPMSGIGRKSDFSLVKGTSVYHVPDICFSLTAKQKQLESNVYSKSFPSTLSFQWVDPSSKY